MSPGITLNAVVPTNLDVNLILKEYLQTPLSSRLFSLPTPECQRCYPALPGKNKHIALQCKKIFKCVIFSSTGRKRWPGFPSL